MTLKPQSATSSAGSGLLRLALEGGHLLLQHPYTKRQPEVQPRQKHQRHRQYRREDHTPPGAAAGAGASG